MSFEKQSGWCNNLRHPSVAFLWTKHQEDTRSLITRIVSAIVTKTTPIEIRYTTLPHATRSQHVSFRIFQLIVPPPPLGDLQTCGNKAPSSRGRVINGLTTKAMQNIRVPPPLPPCHLVLHERPHGGVGLPVMELLPAPRAVRQGSRPPRTHASVPDRVPIPVKVKLTTEKKEDKVRKKIKRETDAPGWCDVTFGLKATTNVKASARDRKAGAQASPSICYHVYVIFQILT